MTKLAYRLLGDAAQHGRPDLVALYQNAGNTQAVLKSYDEKTKVWNVY